MRTQQGGRYVRLGVDPVTRSGARGRGQHAVALEVAHLLDGVPGVSGDIDRAHDGRLATSHVCTSERLRQSLHKHMNETLEHMSSDEIIEFLGGFEGVLTLKPPRNSMISSLLMCS